MSISEHAERPPADTGSPVGFWLLLALASAGFIPCVLLPAWRDYEAVRLAAQYEEQRTEALRSGLDRQRETLDAIRTDPAVAARLARRELGYQRPDEVEVEVPGVPIVSESAPAWTPTPVVPPASGWLARLPAADYDSLFCREPSRTVVMMLSGSVAVAAFALYPPRRRRDQRIPNAGA